MYNVILHKSILQATRDLFTALFPGDGHFPVYLPGGSLELLQSLIAGAESDWANESSYFSTYFGSVMCFDNRAVKPITKATLAVEHLIKCTGIINYGTPPASIDQYRERQQKFANEACRLLRLIKTIADVLQNKSLKNGMSEKEEVVLQVRKHRLRYTDHLADLAVLICKHYYAFIPDQGAGFQMRAQVQRNMAALLIDIARSDEQLARQSSAGGLIGVSFSTKRVSLVRILEAQQVKVCDEVVNELVASGLSPNHALAVADSVERYRKFKLSLPRWLTDKVADGTIVQTDVSETPIPELAKFLAEEFEAAD